jgi:hypothetical protein
LGGFRVKSIESHWTHISRCMVTMVSNRLKFSDISWSSLEGLCITHDILQFWRLRDMHMHTLSFSCIFLSAFSAAFDASFSAIHTN